MVFLRGEVRGNASLLRKNIYNLLNGYFYTTNISLGIFHRALLQQKIVNYKLLFLNVPLDIKVFLWSHWPSNKPYFTVFAKALDEFHDVRVASVNERKQPESFQEIFHFVTCSRHRNTSRNLQVFSTIFRFSTFHRNFLSLLRFLGSGHDSVIDVGMAF